MNAEVFELSAEEIELIAGGRQIDPPAAFAAREIDPPQAMAFASATREIDLPAAA